MEESAVLQFMGSQRAGHGLVTEQQQRYIDTIDMQTYEDPETYALRCKTW